MSRIELRLPITGSFITGFAMFVIAYGAWWNFRAALVFCGLGFLIGYYGGLRFWRLLGYGNEVQVRQFTQEIPQAPVYTRYAEISDYGGGYEGRYRELPVSDFELEKIASLVLSTSVPSFSNAIYKQISGLSRDRFESFRAKIESAGWIALRSPGNPNSGYVVTSFGEYQFRKILDIPSPTLGRGEVVSYNPRMSTHAHTQHTQAREEL